MAEHEDHSHDIEDDGPGHAPRFKTPPRADEFGQIVRDVWLNQAAIDAERASITRMLDNTPDAFILTATGGHSVIIIEPCGCVNCAFFVAAPDIAGSAIPTLPADREIAAEMIDVGVVKQTVREWARTHVADVDLLEGMMKMGYGPGGLN